MALLLNILFVRQMMLEIIVNGHFSEGIKIDGYWISKEYKGNNTHLIIYDELSKRLYDLVADNIGEYKVFKTNKEKMDAIKKEQFVWLKMTKKGIELFESLLKHASFCFGFFDDHIDPFSKSPKKITLEEIKNGLLIKSNVSYFVE